MIGRREFITLGAAAAWPAAARSQQSNRMRRIGVFAGAHNPVIMGPAYQAFLDELDRAGFNQGQNLSVEQRPTDQDLPALTAQAVAMVRANPDALVALGSEHVLQACVVASRTIPIIFVANNYDPIARGYVQSLANPGGNVTGVFLRQTSIVIFRGSKFERNVSTLSIAHFAQSLTESRNGICDGRKRPRIQNADHRHSGLLRARRERPRGRAAE